MYTDTSLLKPGEHAIVIFTYGRYFHKKRDGSGSTGNWVIDENRKCSKVVIYNRVGARNDVYVARRAGLKPSREPGRFIINLEKIHYFGTTYFNWPQFAGSRNPVRYLKISTAAGGRRKANGSDLNAANLELLPAVQ